MTTPDPTLARCPNCGSKARWYRKGNPAGFVGCSEEDCGIVGKSWKHTLSDSASLDLARKATKP